MERWEQRAKKIEAKRRRMRVTGRGLITVEPGAVRKRLEKLHQQYGKEVVLIGFPAGNFGGQELSSNAEIKEFCEANFGVSFLLSEKVSVKGSDINPLFAYLTSQENPDFKGEINWNFEKFLIDEHGKLVHRFRSKVKPLDEEITAKL